MTPTRHIHIGRRPRRAFSLVELLLAIFILGIGVISIAALFPAGIIQQRQSVDDMIGPMVAENAMAILRTKVSKEDFGTFDEFGVAAPLPTIVGDWAWLRPSVIFEDDTDTPDVDERGSLDIFSATWPSMLDTATEFPDGYQGTGLVGIPFNTALGSGPPLAIVTQRERYYPALSEFDLGEETSRPQYVWDCMFRRFNGRVLVAIFVYRITIPGDAYVRYYTPSNPMVTNPGGTPPRGDIPPLPARLELIANNANDAWDQWGSDRNDPSDDALVPNTSLASNYDPFDPQLSWQEAGQWLLDQNNNIHRVLARSVEAPDDPLRVELVRPVPGMANLGINYLDTSVIEVGSENVVSHVWYIPAEVEIDRDGDGSFDTAVTLTPVYVAVQEL
jgi:hypothetical protein